MTFIEKILSGREVQTRDKRKARVLCTDLKGESPIVAAIASSEGEIVYTYSSEGRFVNDNIDRAIDLIIGPIKVTKWVNVYNDLDICGAVLYDTKEEAKKHSNSDDYIGAFPVRIKL